MSVVNAFNDWGKLKEIIVGSPEGLTLPDLDCSSKHFFEPPSSAQNEKISVECLEEVKAELHQDFNGLIEVLTGRGIEVRRPEPVALNTKCVTPFWESLQSHALMPRDCLAAIGNTLIEVPMPSRARYYESLSFRNLALEYFDEGANWIAGPNPVLSDETYLYAADGTPYLAETDPLFDAANLLRCGKDIFFNVSNSGNKKGLMWLQRVLGDQFNVHEMSICSDHVGTTIHILRPGVLLVNQSRLAVEDIPEPFKNWKILWFNDPVIGNFGFDWPRASEWIGMNILSLDENTIIIESSQRSLADLLDREGFEVIPVQFRHGRTIGGGFHCCSLDVNRDGQLESYI